MSAVYRPPSRMRRLALPERSADIGTSLAEAEHSYEIFTADGEPLNLTYANTKRFPPPDWAIQEFTTAATGHGAAYTPYRGDLAVRYALAPALSRFLGIGIDPEQDLILTAGTQAGLFQALAATVEEGDRVLLVDPDYLCNERILRFFGATVEHVPLSRDQGRLRPDLGAIEDGLRKGARMMLMSHPNNPTGAVYDESFLRALAGLLIEHDAFVLVDELYSRLVFDGTAFHHLIAQPQMRERCLTLLGPSKTESMSGYRVGVLVGPPQVIAAVEEVQAVATIRAPAYAQHTLRRWLSDDREFVASRVVEYQALRDLAVEKLRALDFLEVHEAEGTAYLFPDVKRLGLPDLDVAQALLGQANIVINPGFQFGPAGVGSFRICFAQDEQIWDSALDRIVATLARLGAGAALGGAGPASDAMRSGL